jgi:hypothetical protein
VATVSELVDEFAKWSGTRPQEGVVRARHLREAGMLPSGGRGLGGAQVNPIHCATYLVSWLAAERAAWSPRAVTRLNEFQPTTCIGDLDQLTPYLREKLVPGPTPISNPPKLILSNFLFIAAVAWLIDFARTPEGQQSVDRYVDAIGCSRDYPSAFIRLRDEVGNIVQQEYRAPPPPERPASIQVEFWQTRRFNCDAAIGIDAHVPGRVLWLLGNLIEGDLRWQD